MRLAKPCTNGSYQIKSTTVLSFIMDHTLFLVRHGQPGPVFMDLPKELLV